MGILGIDFGGTKVALRVEALNDPSPNGGREKRRGSPECVRTQFVITPGESANQVVARALEAARTLISRVPYSIAAVGVATPGIVLESEIKLAPNVNGWSDLALRQSIVDGLGIELTVVENDVKAAAIAESKSGALAKCDPGLYLNLGTGIAAAVVIGGRVVRGANGAAGEIGYGLVGSSDALDWSGEGAPLEEYVGGRGLGERGAVRFGTDGSGRALLELASKRADVAQFVSDGIDELCRHVLTCVLLVDPQRVVVGGGMSRDSALVIEPIAARLRAALSHAPEVVTSKFGAEASLQGAVEIAKQAILCQNE